MKTLKLVGARTYSCYAAGLKDPVKIGDTAVFEDGIADVLLTRMYYDSANNAHPIWTEDTEAAPVHKPAAKEVTLEEAIKPPKKAGTAVSKGKGSVTRKRTSAK